MRRTILASASALALLQTALAQASETIAYSYDARGRLVKVERSGTINNRVVTTYALDKADNRLTVSTASSSGGTGSSVSFSVASNGPANEGSQSTFTVTKTGSATQTLGVSFATSNGSAVAASDYNSFSGALSFAPSEIQKTISVSTLSDSVAEPDESFTLTLSSPSTGAVLDTASASGVIKDVAPTSPVTFSIASNGPVNEGSPSVFTITKSGAVAGPLTVNYATASGTALTGSDFAATSGTLTFSSTASQLTVSVPTVADNLGEPAENFSMSLSAPSGGATLGSSSATGTINASAANSPPTTTNDTISLRRCAVATKNVTANDTDPEGHLPLQLIGVSSGSMGEASVASSSSITYIAGPAAGTDILTYTVRDSLGATATGRLTVTISTTGTCA